MSPEERVRLVIDEKLKQTGWVIQDIHYNQRNADCLITIEQLGRL